MIFRKIILLEVSFALGLIPFIMLPSYAKADTTRVVEVDAIPVTITVVQRTDGRTPVISECIVPQSQETVWRVLSDYDHLEEFVPFLTESRLAYGPNGEKLLSQEGRAGLWVFKKTFSVTFRLEEHPMREIKFTALEGDFTRFEGSWQIEPTPEGTLVRHEVDIQPAFYVPRWGRNIVERYLMMKSLESVIERFRTSPLKWTTIGVTAAPIDALIH